MTTRITPLALALLTLLQLTACADGGDAETAAPAPAAAATAPATAPLTPSDAVLAAAASQGAEWLTYGRDYAETRFSPLAGITAANVNELGVAWTFDTGAFRGFEASPLVHDGVLYATRPWSSVFALDARTGALL